MLPFTLIHTNSQLHRGPPDQLSYSAMAQAQRRALHYVFKIGKRTETTKFYRDVLGMKVGI